MRSSVRFPLHLPIAVRAESYEHQSQTSDISAGGVLFDMEGDVEVGSKIEFTISLPARVVAACEDVVVKCVGRVVRCSPNGERRSVAAVIDDYQFVR